jgi:AraC-like DNA-binding protein
MSRSAVAARFTDLVGEPAMRYITRWRMQLALSALEDGTASIKQLADRLGYDSQASFSRAFKRAMGVPPGKVQRRRELVMP